MSNRDETKRREEAPKIPLSSELLTTKELAQKLKVSTRKIELDHKLPRILWGRNVRYDWAEVMEYLKGGAAV
ncbi:MAG: hypothetical protein QNL68_00570 [Akkermansiaceae bacterium]